MQTALTKRIFLLERGNGKKWGGERSREACLWEQELQKRGESQKDKGRGSKACLPSSSEEQQARVGIDGACL